MADAGFNKDEYWENRKAGGRGQGDRGGVFHYSVLGMGSNRTNRRKKVHSTKLPESERPKTHAEASRSPIPNTGNLR